MSESPEWSESEQALQDVARTLGVQADDSHAMADACIREIVSLRTTVAALTAENERLVSALTDIAEPMAAIQRVADATGYKVNGMAVSLTNSAEHLRALARAALPSFRETTDG